MNTNKPQTITKKDIAQAVFWLQFNYNSKCPYCHEKIDRDKRGIIVLRHLKINHPDIAYEQDEL